jgi:hypothetical protein
MVSIRRESVISEFFSLLLVFLTVPFKGHSDACDRCTSLLVKRVPAPTAAATNTIAANVAFSVACVENVGSFVIAEAARIGTEERFLLPPMTAPSEEAVHGVVTIVVAGWCATTLLTCCCIHARLRFNIVVDDICI